jgi:uncharacterized hydrophobic protein (TIGR00271 family)
MAAVSRTAGQPAPPWEAGRVIHLRLVVPAPLVAATLDHLRGQAGVAHLVHLPGAAVLPAGDVVLCDVAREAANQLVEWLQDRGIHHVGAISIDTPAAVVSDAAALADELAPGQGADALIWEHVEARARAEAALTPSFLVFLAVATVIAGVGILLDAPILIVGAMVVGPEYGPIAAVSVAVARARTAPAGRALVTLAVGLGAGVVAALVATAAFRATGLAPDAYDLSDRQLTAFISHPDGMTVVVAVLAGIAGMLSLTQARSGALVGVLVSVTTIPAVANIGVATAYGAWGEVGGAAAQLGLNVAGLVVAGTGTLLVQARATGS